MEPAARRRLRPRCTCRQPLSRSVVRRSTLGLTLGNNACAGSSNPLRIGVAPFRHASHQSAIVLYTKSFSSVAVL